MSHRKTAGAGTVSEQGPATEQTDRGDVRAAGAGCTGQRPGAIAAQDSDVPRPAERRAAMTRAQRLKRVFVIDIETCRALRRRPLLLDFDLPKIPCKIRPSRS
jgi:hypothetical protein